MGRKKEIHFAFERKPKRKRRKTTERKSTNEHEQGSELMRG
jgi:hypothetical protein